MNYAAFTLIPLRHLSITRNTSKTKYVTVLNSKGSDQARLMDAKVNGNYDENIEYEKLKI